MVEAEFQGQNNWNQNLHCCSGNEEEEAVVEVREHALVSVEVLKHHQAGEKV